MEPTPYPEHSVTVTYALGTHVDPGYLFTGGQLEDSKRKARALCPDGVLRTCTVGQQDATYTNGIEGPWAYNARVKAYGKTVAGWITLINGAVRFVPNNSLRNSQVFKKERPDG